MGPQLPDWLIGCFRTALLGEIYPQIRAIAARYNERHLLIRYYLDREPSEFDWDSINVVSTNLTATTPSILVTAVDLECVYSALLGRDLDPLGGFIYFRREHDVTNT
jgi:hypothetical protein